MLVATAMMVLGVGLRAPTMQYAGPPEQRAYLQHIFQFMGAFSDIAALYFRDHLWDRPVPYLEYFLEYPVGLGLLIWLLSSAGGNIAAYFGATAAVLIVSGLLVFWLGRYFEGANLWLLALSPTLPLYIVLNWDMVGVLLTVAALALFRCDRDRWGALMLAAAIWTKFFPVVLVPLVLLDRALRRRRGDAAAIGGILGLVSVALNAPFALERTADGFRWRETWLYFFRFNRERPREVSLWNFLDRLGLSTEQINTSSAALLMLGIGATMLLLWHARARGAGPSRDLLLPASLVAFGWLFFINKVYSPQYSLWIAVLLALLGAPSSLAVAFAGVELPFFGASFVALYLYWSLDPALPWFFDQVLLPVMVWHEATILAIIAWSATRLARRAT